MTLDTYSKSVPESAHPYKDRIPVDARAMIYAVADSVTRSSEGSGGVAAHLAVNLLKDGFSGNIVDAVEEVHRKLRQIKSIDGIIGETTLPVACIKDSTAEIVNVGDSPAYLIWRWTSWHNSRRQRLVGLHNAGDQLSKKNRRPSFRVAVAKEDVCNIPDWSTHIIELRSALLLVSLH